MQKYDITDVDFLSSLSLQSIKDTLGALNVCKLLKLPYTEFAIEFPVDIEQLVLGPRACLCRDDGSKIQPGTEEHFARLKIDLLKNDPNPNEAAADAVVSVERTLWRNAPELFMWPHESPGEALTRYRELRRRFRTGTQTIVVRGKRDATGALTYDIDGDALTTISAVNTSIVTGSPIALQALFVLLTALATRDIIKVGASNKRAALGIGKKNRCFEYITTIRVSPNLERDPDGPPGAHASPHMHLRAAHARRQRFGPGNTQTKMIFIQATIVMADSEYVAIRKSYRVLH